MQVDVFIWQFCFQFRAVVNLFIAFYPPEMSLLAFNSSSIVPECDTWYGFAKFFKNISEGIHSQ